jgi:hypothetical protein
LKSRQQRQTGTGSKRKLFPWNSKLYFEPK